MLVSNFSRRDLDLALRADFTTFIHRTFQTVAAAQVYRHNWHIEALAWHLEQCALGQITRLLITLPPRYLKSICGCVALPSWVLGHDPSRRIICASYSLDLANKHALDCREVMESTWYKRIFPGTRIGQDKDTEMNFVTTRQGYRYATSVGGTLTGRGGNMIIVDDALKPEDAMSEARRSVVNEWFDRTLYSRLDDKRRDVIIVIGQRLHADDLAGHILQTGAWVHLNLPAIAEVAERIATGPGFFYTRAAGELLHEEREPKEVLDKLKVAMGSANFSAQYQQSPVPAEGELIKWAWFRYYDEAPFSGSGDEVVQSWDTASKADQLNDYSACTTWLIADKRYYLLDVLRQKLNYPELRKTVFEHAIRWHAKVILIEDKATGTALIQELYQDCAYGVPAPIKIAPLKDKITRMSAQSSKIEAGCVLLPRQAPWLDDFKTELLQFPRGRYDDQVDSLSQFLNWAARRPTWTVEELLL